MCRMLLACGKLDAEACLLAIVDMARGVAPSHERPDLCHDAGWGMVYRVRGTRKMRTYRSAEPIWADPVRHRAAEMDLDVLAVHCRNSVGGLIGPKHVHPRLLRTEAGTWTAMHNGALPQLAAAFGPGAAPLDTDNYLRLVVERCPGTTPAAVLHVLDRHPGGTSANAFFIHPRRAIVVNDFPSDSPHPRFYTLSMLRTDGGLVVASEPCPDLAPAARWADLGRRHAFEILLDRPQASNPNLEKHHG